MFVGQTHLLKTANFILLVKYYWRRIWWVDPFGKPNRKKCNL